MDSIFLHRYSVSCPASRALNCRQHSIRGLVFRPQSRDNRFELKESVTRP